MDKIRPPLSQAFSFLGQSQLSQPFVPCESSSPLITLMALHWPLFCSSMSPVLGSPEPARCSTCALTPPSPGQQSPPSTHCNNNLLLLKFRMSSLANEISQSSKFSFWLSIYFISCSPFPYLKQELQAVPYLKRYYKRIPVKQFMACLCEYYIHPKQ